MTYYKYCVPVTFYWCENEYIMGPTDPCCGYYPEYGTQEGELCGDAFVDDLEAAYRSLEEHYNGDTYIYRHDRCTAWELRSDRDFANSAILYEGRMVSILDKILDWLF